MRLSKFQVVAVTLACLLIAGTAQGQFGKLKSLAKDKLGIPNKTENKPEAQQSPSNTQGQSSQERMSANEGEAKATYGPGVEKSLEVWRRGGPTPEAKTKEVETNAVRELDIKVSNIDARLFDAVRGYKPCNKLESFEILSASQMKVKVDLTGDVNGGSCYLYFKSNGKTVFSAGVPLVSVEQAKQKRRYEAMQREAQLPIEQQVALGRKRIGKLWTVEYANGKTDKWTLVGPVRGDELKYKFKTGAGEPFEITYAASTATIEMGQCMMQASLDDSKSSEGVTMGDCGVPFGTKFTAKIE